MDNRGLLAVIAVLLIGIFTVMMIQINEKTPAEKVGDSVSNLANTMADEIKSDS
ncbi:MAG: hypothetical protein JKY71_01790 [Alphaproteobacteria bacterium]|nr:hypothetical protein [Alphaproteobacteria bacterium]|tara:strand:- start:266 stop:427 length:162 start_codon:yes stop_codon:yes gene_type:complete